MLATILYIGSAVEYGYQGNYRMAGVMTAYALANIFLSFPEAVQK